MGIRVNVSMSGAGFAAAGVEALARIVQGETLAAERLLALSNTEAPLEIGTLIGSSTVIPATDPTEGAAVTYDTAYAARLHEHPEYQFQGGRKGKYLESPALANKDELGAIIAKNVRGSA